MNERLHDSPLPLAGAFDDVCPADEVCEATGTVESPPDTEDDLRFVAVLGYN